MKRREFLGILSGAAAWPVASKAQQAERVRRVGILNILGPDDPEGQTRRAVFEQTLQQLGWMVGRDLKIEIRQIGRDRRQPSPLCGGAGRTRAGRDL